MPHKKSAAKRMRQTRRRAERNRAAIHAIRTQIRSTLEAARGGNLPKAREALDLAYKRLDKAADGGVIHRNAAARQKSRLALAVAKGAPGGAPAAPAAKA